MHPMKLDSTIAASPGVCPAHIRRHTDYTCSTRTSEILPDSLVLSCHSPLTVHTFAAGRSVYLPLSIKHNIDLGSREALRRGVMHLFNIDFALEWPRALPPNVKLVGPLMPEPARALPADLQVHVPGHPEFVGECTVAPGAQSTQPWSVGDISYARIPWQLCGYPLHNVMLELQC